MLVSRAKLMTRIKDAIVSKNANAVLEKASLARNECILPTVRRCYCISYTV